MSNTKDHAFVEIVFSAQDKQYFKNLVNKLVKKESLYDSPIAEHIRGDMTDTLHCTLFFGLQPEAIHDSELLSLLQNSGLEKISLGDFFFFEGYENLYRVLCLEVKDEDHKLLELSKKIEGFVKGKEIKEKEFKPHLTLAYVNKEYKLPGNLEEIRKELDIEDIKVSLLSEFMNSLKGSSDLRIAA